MQLTQPRVAAEPTATSSPTQPDGGSGSALRFIVIAAAVGALVLLAAVAGPDYSPWNPIVRYGLKVSVLGVVALSLLAYLWCRRTGGTWDADLIAALWGGLAALTLVVSLNGTPYGPLGILGDQSFRTAYVTRLADGWQISDYFYRDRPGYYAPLFFWLLGRAADVTALAPWQMIKVGTIAAAFLAPLILYVLWRRHVSMRLAALISGAALLVNDFYEPYGWIVLAAIVPWWIEVCHGPLRPGARRLPPAVTGLIGAALFLTYYYYFFVLPFFLGGYLLAALIRGQHPWAGLRRMLAVLAVAAAGSAVFWLPLAWNFLTARQFYSLNNRWLQLDHADLPLPMLDMSVTGALCLLGLGYLIVTFTRSVLSQTLLLLAVAAYLWHAAGFPLAAVDMPVMSFRMRILVPLVLLVAAILGVAELARRFRSRAEAATVAVVAAVLFGLFAANHFVSTISDHHWIRAAHNVALPDGSLPRYHDDSAPRTEHGRLATPSAKELKAAIDARFHEDRYPVVFSDRHELNVFYPWFGFVQWDFSYSHPTAEFENRLDFLRGLGNVSPREFAAKTADNPFDRIDAIVLRIDGGSLVYHYLGQNYPSGSCQCTLTFSRSVVGEPFFDITTIGEYLVAVRRA